MATTTATEPDLSLDRMNEDFRLAQKIVRFVNKHAGNLSPKMREALLEKLTALLAPTT